MKVTTARRTARFHFSILLGHARRLRSNRIESWVGADPNRGSNQWAVYSHYSRRGQVFDYTVFAMRALCEAGFRIVFVTNSRKFGAEELQLINPYCAQIIKRRNAGYDFGAYKEGIDAIADPMEGLILMNDSVYGPLFPLRDTLERMSATGADLWGLTDSWEHAYHLQSYFLYFKRRLIGSPDFHDFWRSMPLINYKKAVIERLEIGLSQFFLRRGHKLSAAFPYYSLLDFYLASLPDNRILDKASNAVQERLRAHLLTGRPVNPTHYFWDILISEYQYPFIKEELLSRNPDSIYGINRWRDTISSLTKYDAELIVEHQKHFDRQRWHGVLPLIRN